MARERSWATRIVKAFFAELQKMADDEVAWLTRFRTFALGPATLIARAPRPALALDVAPQGPTDQMLSGLDQHGESITLEVSIITEDAEDPVGALQDAIADVRRCARQNENFTGVLPAAHLRDRGWARASTQGIEGGAGLGAAVVYVQAFYESDEENP